ncbi:MAG: DUF4832 domain-containing protein [Bacteroidales bacterium]|nr:DUF4832 domain-containing protein [Bacteroidales bacterium]
MKRLLMLLAIALVACNPIGPSQDEPAQDDNGGTSQGDPAQDDNGGPSQGDPAQDDNGKDDNGKDDKEGEAYNDYVRVPLQSVVDGVQPMTGIVLWTDSEFASRKEITLEFSYVRYNDVCKEKDVYDWSTVDKILSGVAAHGHQAIIRFYYSYPGRNCTVPDYIKALPDYEETKGKSEGRSTTFPDWRCEELQRFHKEFYRLFAERYDNDPRLAFLETGFGLWAEYHIYDGPFYLGKTFPGKEFQAEFLAAMPGWFKKTPWLISIDAANGKYGPFKAYPELKDVAFGNFDDSFMCEEHDDDNRSNWKYFGADRYKTAPEGGEFSYYTSYDQKHCLDRKGMYGRKFEDEVAKYHLSFIIGNDQPEYQSWSRIVEASQSMGYHFRVCDFRVKPGTGAAVRIENTGVAPLYYDAFLDVDGVRSEYNLRELLPGGPVWVEIQVPDVSEHPVLSIACDRLVAGQKIGFEADVR